MRKILNLILIASVLLTVSCSNAPKEKTSDVKKAKEVVDNKLSDNTVNILYFFGKRRCHTCVAIENQIKEIFASYKENTKVKLKLIDTSVEANKSVVERYKVAFSTLLIVRVQDGVEHVSNQTSFAFTKAASNPSLFKTNIKSIIDSGLKSINTK